MPFLLVHSFGSYQMHPLIARVCKKVGYQTTTLYRREWVKRWQAGKTSTMKPDSIFEIGSITKTFTGLILSQMVEEGKVKFDDPVRTLLPPETVASLRAAKSLCST